MTKRIKIIGFQGVNASGKSTLAHLLSRNYPESDTVATDNLLAINRMLNPNDVRLKYSSYSSWERYGEPNRENIWKAFCEYREANRSYIDCILKRARDQRVSMIIEGLHLEPKLFELYKRDLETKLYILVVSNEERHKERIRQKCNYRPELLLRLEKYFPYIRTIQELLIEEGRKFGVDIIETGSDIENSLKEIEDKER